VSAGRFGRRCARCARAARGGPLATAGLVGRGAAHVLQRLAVSCSLRAIAARVATSCPPPPPARGSGAPCDRGRKQGQAEGIKDARTQGGAARGSRACAEGPALRSCSISASTTAESLRRAPHAQSAPSDPREGRPRLSLAPVLERTGSTKGWGTCWLWAQGGGGGLPVDVRRARGEADGSCALKRRREGGARSREVDVARNLRPKDPPVVREVALAEWEWEGEGMASGAPRGGCRRCR
jgi:hypothetical protein